MRTGRLVGGAMLAALLAASASAQTDGRQTGGRQTGPEAPRGTHPGRLGFGADNDAQPGGVPGNAPFNNQLRKFTDPLGANGSR